MLISRRVFTGGALGVALGGPFSIPALAQVTGNLSAALEAIRAYGEAHRRYYDLPGMTLGVTTPDGFATVLNFGYANRDSRTPIAAGTLFQIGSATKSMVAALTHQLASQGRFGLSDRISGLLPDIPLPANNGITVQHLLDHTSGLPDWTPLSSDGGLWTGFPPGEHWSYSNTGYTILGKLAEQAGGKPLSDLLSERLLVPLGMALSRGAIRAADRPQYAQGYEAADPGVPFARGMPLAPAPWVDVTEGFGCIASTAADMCHWLRTLANAAQGRGGAGLSPALARAFTSHHVPTDTRGMSYGNGLMHVGERGRSYLHHTGGMVSFSSSFHVDVASGVGAFASANVSAFVEYRPRQLTRFAVDALTDALAHRPIPAPPPLGVRLPNPAAYIGTFTGAAGRFEVRPGAPLTLFANGQSAAFQPWGGETFRTTHPAFREFSFLFARKAGVVAKASWGAETYLRGEAAPPAPSPHASLAPLTGRYVNSSPWLGTMRVVEREGKLWIGTESPMEPIGTNLWRVGDDPWSPERGSFADFVEGRPQTFIFSGEKFARADG
jgi:CubicO group peptidase (beta-lactamase class C family)